MVKVRVRVSIMVRVRNKTPMSAIASLKLHVSPIFFAYI